MQMKRIRLTGGLATLLEGDGDFVQFLDGNLFRLAMQVEKAKQFSEAYYCASFSVNLPLGAIGGENFQRGIIEDIKKLYFLNEDAKNFGYAIFRIYNEDGFYELNIVIACAKGDKQYFPYLHKLDAKRFKIFRYMLCKENPKIELAAEDVKGFEKSKNYRKSFERLLVVKREILSRRKVRYDKSRVC